MDHICFVDLLPKDKEHHEEMDDDSAMPTDWLKHTWDLHPALDISYCKGTWKRFFMGNLKTHYRQFSIGVDSHFKNIHHEHSWAHLLKTQQYVKSLQAVNEK